MGNFFIENYLLLTYLVEILAALTGVLCFKAYKHTSVRYFIYFLMYLTLCDTFGGYNRFVREDGFLSFLIDTPFEKNYWWSTLYWKIGAILFLGGYYQHILTNKWFKRVLKYALIAFASFSLFYIIFNWQAFFVSFFPAISVSGSLIVFMCSVFYFIEILQSDELLTFYNTFNFYVTVAIFMWWLIITPIVFYDIYGSYDVGNNKRDFNYLRIRMFIYLFSNISMYLTFMFALIFCKPKTKP